MVAEINCITIPLELQEYKIVELRPHLNEEHTELNFGVKIIKNQSGEVERTDYYTSSGDLIKSVYYSGFAISEIQYFRNSELHAREIYSDGKLVSKGLYDKTGIISGIAYQYNRQCKITSIEKAIKGNHYLIEYGYDELDRVNSRKISVNRKFIDEQTYRFDILDRIVEYKDKNQTINVLQISKKNELIYYTITDRIGNKISVVNQFDNNEYLNTEILLNGHKTTIKNKNYLGNIMLKKPYTSEDDLDLIIANLFRSDACCITERSSDSDMIQNYIDTNISARVLPISIRKRLLYNHVVNL